MITPVNIRDRLWSLTRKCVVLLSISLATGQVSWAMVEHILSVSTPTGENIFLYILGASSVKLAIYFPYKCLHRRKGEVWEMQLKGSGKTPYSRCVGYFSLFPFSSFSSLFSCFSFCYIRQHCITWYQLLLQVRRWSSCDPFFCEGVPVQWSHACPGCPNQQGCQVREEGKV